MTDNAESDPAVPENELHCSAEWHMVQMKSRLVAPVYTLACKLSKKSGSFYASAQNLAAYFRVDRKVIHRALKELATNGFFKLVRAELGKPNVYKVIDHKEWTAIHPGLCVQEVSFPWKGEGDPLAPQLYAISGGRAKFWPNQMTGLRNLGFANEEIAEQFRRFLAKWDYIGSAWNHVYYDFRKELKTLATRSDVSHRRDTILRIILRMSEKAIPRYPLARHCRATLSLIQKQNLPRKKKLRHPHP